MGRRPLDKTIDDLEPTLLGQIDEAIRSHADETAASIYRKFGLAQRGINVRTFRRYVEGLRSAPAAVRLDVCVRADEHVPEWEEIDRLARRLALDRLNAGDAKVYELVLLSRSRRESDKLGIEQAAEKRAAELHESKLKALRTRLEEAVKEGAGGGETQGSKDLHAVLEQVAAGTMNSFGAAKAIGDMIWIEIDKQMRGAA